jgi:transaldolase
VIDEHRALREELLFETTPEAFPAAAAAARDRLAGEFVGASAGRRHEIAALIADLAIDLGSYLVRWHLLPPGGGSVLTTTEVTEERTRFEEVLLGWDRADLLADIAEEVRSIGRSNLRRLSELADAGEVDSRWGHDAASGLTWAIRRGAVLVTTNPVMVNGVRKDDPATWDRVRDALKAEHPDATAQQRASLMTMSVVLDECRELLPIWRATDGRYGFVSLQIDPRANDDAGRMVEEVQDLYGRLERELGGVPNTRFKIPATSGGLDAVRRLTAQGIGVTVTVNASVDQQLAFAEAIEQGSAPLSLLVLMMGRLDDPVRDELAAAGLGDATEASRWASVAVLRRAYPLLFEERGYRRSAILAASMRGPWTIDGAIVEGPSEVFVTCFPDKAREYDETERPIVSRIHEPVPAEVIAKLSRSETFRGAYEVGALDVASFDSFVPVVQTLDQFSRNYEEFLAYNA